jgi:bacillolysin
MPSSTTGTRRGHMIVASALLAALGSLSISTPSVGARPDPISAAARVDRAGAATFLGGTTARPLMSPSADDPAEIAERFADRAAPLHGISADSDVVADRTTSMADGGTTVRLQQSYDGIPVLGGELAVRVAANGSVLSSAGEVLTDAASPQEPIVSAEAARAAAISLTSRNDAVASELLLTSTPELMVYESDLIGAPDDGIGPRVVWKLDVHTELGDVDRFVLIDAVSGAIALTFSAVHAAQDVRVCDNAQVLTTSSAQQACLTPVRSTANPTVSAIADVNDAYDFSVATYNFYSTVLGRDSIDGAGMPIRSTVRFCVSGSACPYANAFWNGQQMVYGTGMATDDVLAHELTHGVTQYEAGLLYYAESGAINESISDVFGELLDQWYVTPGDALDVRWEVGEDTPFTAIRSMSDPTLFGDPDRMTSPNYHGAETDEHGVHINSGVGNKAAFLMTDGGTFNNQTIIGLGPTKTAKIFYEALTGLLTAGSDYRDLAAALQQACANLTPATTTVGDCAEVAKVVTATEMTLDPITPGSKLNAEVCPSGLFRNQLFVSDFETANADWSTSSGGGAWIYSTEASQSGSRSAYGVNQAVQATSELAMTNAVLVPAGTSYFRFDHTFSFDAEIISTNQAANRYWDGGIVEYNTGSGWIDIASLPGNAALNGYNVTLRTSGGGNNNPFAGRAAFGGNSPAFQSTRYTISSLAGQSVRFRLRIGTDSSIGYPGWFVDDVAIYTCGGTPSVPSAPGQVTAVAGSGTATLSWSAPTVNGGAAITDYVIEQSTNGGGSWSPVVDALSAVTSATVSGLTNLTEHVFRVAAVNSVGTGTFGAPSAAVLPAAAPSGSVIAALPPTLSVGDATPALGQVMPFSRGGFVGNEWVAIVVDAPPRVIGTVRATNGSVAGNAIIPNDLAAGKRQLALFGLTSTTGTRTPISIGLSNDGFSYPTGSGFTALAPTRVFDTRPGEPQGAVAVVQQRYGGGVELRLQLAGAAGVPALGASAVSLNLTAVDPQGSGFVTAYSCGTRPVVSSLNFVAGDVVPNAVIVPLSSTGEVCFYSSANTHLLADINGWFASGAGFTAVTPTRVFDTRPEEPQGASSVVKQRYGPASVLRVRVAGRAGVPATGIAAVSLNVVAINPDSNGFVTVYPCGTAPLASNLNYVRGQVVPNAVIAPVSAEGDVCFFSSAGTHLLADINGWFATASGFTGLTPVRVFDSRVGEAQGAVVITKQRYGGAIELRVRLTGVAGLPNAGVGAVSLNVTVVNPSRTGFVTVYPCGTRPTASSLNYVTGQVVPNAVITPVSSTGEVCFYSSAATDLLADINGWITG